MTEQPPAGEAREDVPSAPEPRQVRLRRAPRYRAFVAAGALVGVVVGIVASTLLGNTGSFFPETTLTGYLATIGLLLGCLLGGLVAVLAERPRQR